jgi:transposase
VSTPPEPTLPPHSEAFLAEINAQLKQRLDATTKELEYARLKIQLLEERLHLQRIEKYGPGSEKLSSLQLELLEQEPGVSNQEVAAESEREAPPPVSEAKKKRKHPGRQTLPADLPRVERIIACTSEQCVCGNCGAETKGDRLRGQRSAGRGAGALFCAGDQTRKAGVQSVPGAGRGCCATSHTDHRQEPGFRRRNHRHGGEQVLRPQPTVSAERGLVSRLGIDISRATMCGWVMTIGEMLMPVAETMRRHLLAGTYIQADETPVDVQTHDGSGTNHQGYLWQYGTPGGMTVFDFRMSRKREGPLNFLGNFEGLLQTDAYAAYDRVGGAKMVHAGCWSHARRYFVDAVKLNKQDAASIRAVQLMDKLFAIDAQAREENMDHAPRHALRGQHARPLLEEIRNHILAMSKTVLPKSAAGQACSYTLAIWKRLTRFLDYPELELSTNLAENSMRPIAVGRANWIHIGSEQAGPRIAAILSVVESCRRLKIPIRNYLADILPGLANASVQRIADITPVAWTAKHP